MNGGQTHLLLAKRFHKIAGGAPALRGTLSGNLLHFVWQPPCLIGRDKLLEAPGCHGTLEHSGLGGGDATCFVV